VIDPEHDTEDDVFLEQPKPQMMTVALCYENGYPFLIGWSYLPYTVWLN